MIFCFDVCMHVYVYIYIYRGKERVPIENIGVIYHVDVQYLFKTLLYTLSWKNAQFLDDLP